MKQNRTVKVQIPLTVEIDVDAWSEEYGRDYSAAELREDVRRYVRDLVRAQLVGVGVPS